MTSSVLCITLNVLSLRHACITLTQTLIIGAECPINILGETLPLRIIHNQRVPTLDTTNLPWNSSGFPLILEQIQLLESDFVETMSSVQLNATTPAFSSVEAEASCHLDDQALLWWGSSGYALAVLLDEAGYSNDAQCRLLRFIRAVIPSLGNSQLSGKQNWKSFMTDDHTPIELSWDWRTSEERPKIRFSIEPISPHAGTPLDPDNEEATLKLLCLMRQALPGTQWEWLAHFRQQLSGSAARGSMEGHSSKEFYAFDMGEEGLIGKAYFFPGFVAKKTGQMNIDVIAHALHSAPCSAPEKLRALKEFQDYIRDPESPPAEMDMLAIDLVDPEASRFKIYFRVRDSSFTSIRRTITMGNRLINPEIESGLRCLRQLYHDLQSTDTKLVTDDTNVLDNNHRTGGILYNAEFKYGCSVPKVKIYLPVRHFAKSEVSVISALEKHFQRTQGLAMAKFLRYKHAIYKLL